MSQIKVATQNKTKPHAKTPVYFVAHPADFEKHFDSVCEEFFAGLDCAMYYYEPGDSVDIETRRFDLSQIQLFVVVVTQDFMQLKSDAYDFDFKYALENNIPFIPIVCEPGAGKLLEKQFPNNHYIDKTEGSYKSQLKKAFHDITKKKFQAQKLQDIFEGNAFISYRKADRMIAGEVIKTLHKPEVNSRLYLWYDDFLIPGENFNENIAGAIEKSDIFIMVVTPEILDSSCYVHNCEYPLAKKLDKPILPVEAVKTNRTTLEELYPDIPNCVGIDDLTQLSEAIDNALGTKKGSEMSADAYYSLGVAYLEGIGMESNTEAAIQQFLRAADKGHLHSTERLAKIYEQGLGIPVDYPNAIKWRKKAAELTEKRYKESGEGNRRGSYCETLRSLAQCYKKCGMIDEAVEALDRGISLVMQFNDKKSIRWKYTLSQKKVEMYVESGRCEEGLPVYNGFINELELQQKRDRSFTQELCATYDIGQKMYRGLGKPEMLIVFAKKLIKIVEGDRRSYGKPTQALHSIAYNNMGVVHWESGNFQLAEDAFKKAIEVYDGIKNLNVGKDLRNLGITYHNLAGMYYDFDRFDLALDNYHKALKYFNRFSNRLDIVKFKFDIAAGMYKIYMKKEEYEAAQSYARMADEYHQIMAEISPETAEKYLDGWHKRYLSHFEKGPEPEQPEQKEPEADKPEQKKPESRNFFLDCCKFIVYIILKCIYGLVIYPIIVLVALLVVIIKKIKEKKL